MRTCIASNSAARIALVAALLAGSGCATTSSSLPSSSSTATSPSTSQAQAGHTASRLSSADTTPSLCIAGTQYSTTLDDEFSSDTSLSTTSTMLGASGSATGVTWSTRAFGFGNNGTRNNVGTDDAYYTDSARGFGGYSPFTLANGALNITAEPVPASYAGSSELDGAHWLSGVLEGPAQTYGYVEVSAREPNLRGFWPAPLWLLGLRGNDGAGNGYEELDVNELFGNSLPKSTVQQTQIFSLSGQPPANVARSVVSPDPSTAFHTYGVLWTPSTVQYFIDRTATSAAFPNAANGPANPIINLQVFTNHTWAPGPATQTPQTMSLQYFRWYQNAGGTCAGSSGITSIAPPTPQPSATPMPQPSATPMPQPSATPTPQPSAPTTPTVVQNSGATTYTSPSSFTASLGQAPQTGDRLIAVFEAWTPPAVPTGWTALDAPSRAGFFVYTATVGAGGVAPASSYSFGTNNGVLQLLDVRGAASTSTIVAAADPVQWVPQFLRSLPITSPNGLLLSAWGGYAFANGGLSAINEQLPSGQAQTALVSSTDNHMLTGGAFSLRVDQITTDPALAPQPYTVVAAPSVSSSWILNGTLIWVPAS